jgi:hypothetical protein
VGQASGLPGTAKASIAGLPATFLGSLDFHAAVLSGERLALALGGKLGHAQATLQDGVWLARFVMGRHGSARLKF